VASINQNLPGSALPDFRNIGVVMRVLLAVIAMQVAVSAARAPSWRSALDELVGMSALAQPTLILSLVALAALSVWLRRLPYAAGVGVVVALELGLTALVFQYGHELLGGGVGATGRALAFALAATCVVLGYFNLRGRALSPALTEARLQALQARIRPHFLFNSINAVLSLIRADPKRAEHALEDMADLFRVMLADTGQLSPMEREVELCREYLNLEQLRLGDRLNVEWRLAGMPGDALIPPLVLQPLVENAVYHGIEPRIEPGAIAIEIYRRGDQLHAVITNPYQENSTHHAGNRMALANIRERLALRFDALASLTARVENGVYVVRIALPYIVKEPG